MSSTDMITRCLHDLPALPRRSCHACSSMINELRNPTLSPWKPNLIHNAAGCLLLSLACFRTLSHSHTFVHTLNHANLVFDVAPSGQIVVNGHVEDENSQFLQLAPDVANAWSDLLWVTQLSPQPCKPGPKVQLCWPWGRAALVWSEDYDNIRVALAWPFIRAGESDTTGIKRRRREGRAELLSK